MVNYREYEILKKKMENSINRLSNIQREKDYKIKRIENKYDEEITICMRDIHKFEDLVATYKKYIKEN